MRQPVGWFYSFSVVGLVTMPLMRSTDLGEDVSFDFTTTTLVNRPIFPVLYFTSISPPPFGGIGSFGHRGTTQPHDEKAEVTTSGAEPWLLK